MDDKALMDDALISKKAVTVREIAAAFNRNGIDNDLNVPDFVLADLCWDTVAALCFLRMELDQFYNRRDPRETDRTRPNVDERYAAKIADAVIEELQKTERPRRPEGDTQRRATIIATVLRCLQQEESDGP